ncbi:MAG: hypothetical protein JWO05_3528 [Gemmatimonadetes bacterium]|nr:hypothetical protein [Gemmatimonadota bacterium]
MRILTIIALLASAACGSSAKQAGKDSEPQPSGYPLAAYASRRIAVVPVQMIADEKGLLGDLSRRIAMRSLDSAISRALDDRALHPRWVVAEEVVKSSARNSNYTADPYAYSVAVLDRLPLGERMGEPLSSQLRTMVALQSDVRFVLIPHALNLEKQKDGSTRATLRLAMVDARATDLLWSGEVQVDTPSAPGPALWRALGTKLAALAAP